MNIEDIKKEYLNDLQNSKSLFDIENLRLKYLGKKGIVIELLKSLKEISVEKRRIIGPEANSLRNRIEKDILEKKQEIINFSNIRGLDITAPGKKIETGNIHPLSQVKEEIEEIFASMGFSLAEGPEIENDFYHFETLNLPFNHPARGMWDTFWLKAKTKDKRPKEKRLLLRAHTSPVQVRYMEKNRPPLRMLSIGKAFRYEDIDASHNIQFYQVECLMVDKDISMANFKAVVSTLFKKIFSRNVSVRFRPSYFPFVEPGLELDITCPRCNKNGCSLCKNTGWLELGGAGMVHPNVFKYAGYNPKYLKGFAFGFGLERIAMIKYNIPDIRLFYTNDLRFLKQF